MATLMAFQNGNLNASNGWKTIATGTNAEMTTVSSSTNTTTSYVDSSAFTVSTSQTLEGLLLHCKRLTTTGTVSVALSDNNGTTATREVTVNASDLPDQASWVFFKFGTTLASDGGTDYKVKVKGSSAGNAVFYRDGTAGNWARRIRKSTTATAAASDVLLIPGELTGTGTGSDFTITVAGDYSATAYGNIDIYHRGILQFATTASSTFKLACGNMSIFGGGKFNIGTAASPIPRTSTATLDVQGSFANIDVLDGGTFNACGQSRTSGKDVYYCLLNTDEAVNSTSLGVDTDTGWLDNDEIAVAPTGVTVSEYERGAMNGNATSNTLTVDGFAGTGGGLAFAHSGTAPMQAEVVLLTRNVVITSTTQSNVHVKATGATATMDIRWVYFPIWNSQGSELAKTTTGSARVQYCSFKLATSAYVSINFRQTAGTSNVSFLNNVVFHEAGSTTSVVCQFGRALVVNTGTNNIFDGNVFIGQPHTDSVVEITAQQITFTNNRISGGSNIGCAIRDSSKGSDLSGNHIRSCTQYGLDLSSAGFGVAGGSIVHCNAGNSSSYQGLRVIGSWRLNNLTLAGNYRTQAWVYTNVEFNDCYFSGTTTVGSTHGVEFINSTGIGVFNNCEFRSSSGVYAAHTTADINPPTRGNLILRKTKLGASTEFTSTAMGVFSAINAQDYDATVGSHKVWKAFGTVTNDTTIYKTASPSERLTPSNASNKLPSATKLVAVDSGTTKSVKVWVRESVSGDGTDYNGNRVRLICRRSDGAGVTSDSVLATATASSEGAWQQLTGTTPAITADAVLELYVDCDGTTGWVNVDDWTVS